jgi:hypothetical protein
LDEEFQYQSYIKEFKFEERKKMIEIEIEARNLVYYRSLLAARKLNKTKAIKKMYENYKDYDLG